MYRTHRVLNPGPVWIHYTICLHTAAYSISLFKLWSYPNWLPQIAESLCNYFFLHNIKRNRALVLISNWVYCTAWWFQSSILLRFTFDQQLTVRERFGYRCNSSTVFLSIMSSNDSPLFWTSLKWSIDSFEATAEAKQISHKYVNPWQFIENMIEDLDIRSIPQ